MAASAVLGAALFQSMRLERTDLATLERMPFASRTYARETAILEPGDTPADLYVVVSGVAARAITTRSGARQITGFLLPGDVFDWPLYRLNSRLAAVERSGLDHAIVAASTCTVAMVRAAVLRKATQELPPLAEAFERRALRDQAIVREWLVNIGTRRAGPRLGHLICELYARLRAMGLAQRETCPLPVTQIHLAEALGLSSVHVNRELKSLREEGLMRFSGGLLSLPDLHRLERLSDFSNGYLEVGRARRWVVSGVEL